MKKIGMLRKLLLTILVFLFFSEVYSQSYFNRRYTQKYIVQIGTGTSSYFGDVVDDYVFTINGNFTAGMLYRFQRRFAVDANLTWFRLAAEDSKSEVKALRGLSFFSNNYELSVAVQVMLFEEQARFYLRRNLNPYIFAGVGLLYYNPKAEYQGEKYNLRPLKTEGVEYSAFTAAFPFGGGVKIKINAFFNVALEGRFTYTLTDYMDDVSSGIYPDPSSFTDPIARALSDRSGEAGADPIFSLEPRSVRGNPGRKDSYLLVLAKIQYYISPFSDTYRALRSRTMKNRRGRRMRR
jgi:hypothetical protein